jgi:hypothetical protein
MFEKLSNQRSYIFNLNSSQFHKTKVFTEGSFVQFLKVCSIFLLAIFALQVFSSFVAVCQELQTPNREAQMSEIRQITEALKNSDLLAFEEIAALQNRWEEAVRKLLNSGNLTKGMTAQSLVEIMGEPSNQRSSTLEWYLSSPSHINPGLIAHVDGNKVIEIEISRW